MAPLSTLTVVELPGTFAVRYCAHMFVTLGARVIQVRLPGTPADSTVEAVAERTFVDAGKERLELALETDVDAVEKLLAGADIVLTSSIPGAVRAAGLLDESGSPRFPSLILGLLTDYGFEGPYAGYRGTSLTGHAAGGYLYINGDPDREPLRGLTYQPYAQTGLHGFLVIMAALLERRRSGLGQRVSASVMQTVAPLHEWTTVRYSHGGFVQQRLGNRYPLGYPIRVYRTKERYWAMTVVDQKHCDLLLALAGFAEAVGDPRFESHTDRGHNSAEIDAMVQPWLLTQSDAELVEQFESIKLTAAPIYDFAEVMADEALRAREFWRQVPTDDGRTATVPGEPVRSLVRTAATNTRVFKDMAPAGSAGPLAGLRVLDLTAGWSGPHGLRMLGDLGADVVRVEPPWYRGAAGPDEAYVQDTAFYMNNEVPERYWMAGGNYNKWAYNKRNVALRMNTEGGREVIAGLVRWADIVIDNFSTQAWEKLGLTYDWMKSINPAVIAISMPGYGRWGPSRNRVSYGNQIEAYTGADSLMGYEGGEPHMFSIAWPDPVAGAHAAAYGLVGIWERDTMGEGQFFEVAQAEGALNFLGPDIAKFSLTGAVPQRIGNRHERWAPQGVYPARGIERWLALSVPDQDAWLGLCASLQRPDLAARPDLQTAEGRHAAHDELDVAIAAWSRKRDAREATALLQDAGVAAFLANDARDLIDDPYLWSSKAFIHVEGEPLPGFPYDLSRTPPALYRPVADVGEHNREALREAGFTGAQIAAFEAAGVLADHPTL